MELKNLFDAWGQKADAGYSRKQWLLSKWEVVDGVEWSDEKIAVMVKTLVDGLQLDTTQSLIDLGCGGGWISQALKPYVQKTIGLDFSPAMLAPARRAYPQATFLCGEIGRLPLRDDSCDRALSYFVFPHRFQPSFNPFYYPGQPPTVDWRFDVILEKP